ncbi:MAG: DUF362 domain-containing protein [Chitinispirillia bacterium]|nr:DUF362 domain-containing protein [Chitinispirillia bacterium]
MNKPRVAIAHDPDIKKALGQTFELLGSLSGLFTDKHVAIKPDDSWASAKDSCACTQADTVKALIELIKIFKPYKITVAGGCSDGESDQVFQLLGIDNVIIEKDVEFFDLNRGPFKSVSLKWGPVKNVVINPHIFSFDTIISLSQHKSNKKTGASLSMKNIAMSLPANDYYGHPDIKYERGHEAFFADLHGFIAGMCQRFPIQLSIINGHPAMIDKHCFDSQIVIASKDFVAADAVGARVMEIEKPVAHIEQAAALCLGQSKLENMEIAGISVEEAAEIFALSGKRSQMIPRDF